MVAQDDAKSHCRRNNTTHSSKPHGIGVVGRPCKYGEQCHRPDCWFDHPTTNVTPTNTNTNTTTTTTLFEIPAPPIKSSSSNNNNKNTTTTTTKPYQFCSPKECKERQEMGQVSVFEATAETAMLPQHQRLLDPALAIAKYRRSAAGAGGMTDLHKVRSKETLELTLQQLSVIAAMSARRPTTNTSTRSHPTPTNNDCTWQGPWSEFLVDRLRACQADATRLFDQPAGSSSSSSPKFLPPTWHVQMARIVIWVRYWMPWKERQSDGGGDKWMEQTLDKMLSTAMEHYWSTTTSTILQEESSLSSSKTKHDLDDELLCYAALSRLVKTTFTESSLSSGTTTLGAILLDYSKHVPIVTSSRQRKEKEDCRNDYDDYPLYQEALRLTAALLREEYFAILAVPKKSTTTSTLPILARCCLAPGVATWQYRQCQQYNVSFAKEEAVKDLDALLHIGPDATSEWWSPDYVQAEFGLPCRPQPQPDAATSAISSGGSRSSFAVIFKQVAMPDEKNKNLAAAAAHHPNDDDNQYQYPPREDYWVFGKNSHHTMCMPEEDVLNLLSLE
jgi:hypothetical protein